jgi:Plasmid pRiA4b ORF-3-like protein
MADRVYQFKITMKDITPVIWRRIVVPETYNFWDLHVAIQDAMGWLDYHLHCFRIRRKHSSSVTTIGIPFEEELYDGGKPTLAGWEIPIADYFDDVGTTADYDYDFGDG